MMHRRIEVPLAEIRKQNVVCIADDNGTTHEHEECDDCDAREN